MCCKPSQGKGMTHVVRARLATLRSVQVYRSDAAENRPNVMSVPYRPQEVNGTLYFHEARVRPT